jgi:hypothetical protein
VITSSVKGLKNFGIDQWSITAVDIELAAVRGGLGGIFAPSIVVGVKVRRVGVGVVFCNVWLRVLLM